MRVLKAIARLMAAVMVMVVAWCEQTLKFVVRCLPGYQPPNPSDLVDEYIDAADAAPVAPEPDQRLQNLQLAAEALFRNEPLQDVWLVGLSEQRLDWLETLDADMLLMTARAKPEDLQEHLAGRKTIRGLLRFEADAIEAYRRAVEMDREPPRTEPTPARRTRRRQEPLLPAFGPIC